MSDKLYHRRDIINLWIELAVLNMLGWILISIIIFFPSSVLRIVLGVPFLLFFPGYTLMAALFTKKDGMDSIERVAFSFCLSIAVVALTGFILNYTPWGIRLEPILYSVTSFILITSVIAWLRRRGLTELERFTIKFHMKMPSWGKGIANRVLAITLMIAILGALGILSYTLVIPKTRETFTEFYILGQGSKAENYPIDLKIGEESSIIVGITNHEGKEARYRLEVVIGGEKITETDQVVLVDEQKWKGEVSFMPEVAGEYQKVEFFLYKDDDVKPYLNPVYLWVDVRE